MGIRIFCREQVEGRKSYEKAIQEKKDMGLCGRKKFVGVIQAALDNNMLVDDLKERLIEENLGHEVTFKVI